MDVQWCDHGITTEDPLSTIQYGLDIAVGQLFRAATSAIAEPIHTANQSPEGTRYVSSGVNRG
jgi:hypothetical protein